MGETQKSTSYVEHAPDCARVLSNEAACNCLFHWNRELHDIASVFKPATINGPAGTHVEFDEHEEAAIRELVTGKKRRLNGYEMRLFAPSTPYQPLFTGETRILELHHDQLSAPLRGSVHVVSIDFTHLERARETYGKQWRQTNYAISIATGRPVWYTALSYVWGLPTFDQTILLESSTIKITSSLASALLRLRSSEYSIFLWIDQVCINQLDVREKEQQIPLMNLVYTYATNTVIWLGDEDGQDPAMAFNAMEKIYLKLQMTDAQITHEDFARLDFPPSLDRSWWAIRQLFRRPWFLRLWTIQETILSRYLFVKCGEAVVCFDDLAMWCNVLQSCNLLTWLEANDALVPVPEKPGIPNHGRISPSGGVIINSLQAERHYSLTHVSKENLLLSLVSTRYAQATEPKDKVYGVLGITKSNIVPDYSSSSTARDVYREACLTQMPTFIYEILSCVDHDVPLKPSWVPDWSTARVTEALGFLTKSRAVYNAGGKSETGQPVFSGMRGSLRIGLSIDKHQVTLSGVIFDKVDRLGCVNGDFILDLDNFEVGNQGWLAYFQLAKETCGKREYPDLKTSTYDAFWRTLMAGRDGSGTAAPTQDHSEVFSLILDTATGEMPSLPGQVYSSRRLNGHFTMDSLRTRKPAKTLQDIVTATRSATTMRRFAITQKGYFALTPRGAQEGDDIVVFDKGCVPFVIRKSARGGNSDRIYELLGETYVHGVMQGEVMEMRDSKFVDVTLV